MTDPAMWDVATLSAAFGSGSLSPVEVLSAVRARIAAFEPTINALVRHDAATTAALDRESALAAAQSEERWRRGEWQQRGDRYSEIRTAETAALRKIEMSYIGG